MLLVLLQAGLSAAAGLEAVVVFPPAAVPAGGQVEFRVYLNNSGETPLGVDFPETVACRLASGKQQFEVLARAAAAENIGPLEIGAGQFVKARYSLTLPETLEGPVRLRIVRWENASALFAVRRPAASEDMPAPAPAYGSLDSLMTLYQPYLKNIAAYEPMYFLVGTDPEKSKFQVSFKYRFFNPGGPLALRHPWVKGIHFAYTQTSFWNLKSASMPFEDTSYKPELFFLSSSIDTGALDIRRLFLQGGFQHESNGRGGDASRSTNFLYVKPTFIWFDEASRLGLQVSPRIWTYVANDEETNPDLDDYRGYADLELKLGKADSLVVGTHLGWAAAGASFQVDLSYPLRRFLSGNIDLYLQAQYVNRLAESLLYYRDRCEAVRLGLAIVR